MELKSTLGWLLHSVLFALVFLLILSTIRYVSSFYTAIDPLGDKKLAVLVFLIGLALVICILGYILARAGFSVISLAILRKIELWIPVLSILGNIVITIINLRKL